ncbi:MAG: hypothetical protein KDL87_17430 [Verrucomicrobiae bacterium]|nr:hypothetical protein [Verrucomicrobiae bacterium]
MKISTTISLDEGLLEAARAFARSERRSLSAQIEAWIEEKLTEDAEASLAGGRRETPHHLTPDPNADLRRRAVVPAPDESLSKGGAR